MKPVKKWILRVIVLMCLTTNSFAQMDNPLGQTIEINTRFHSYVGKPIWSLVIRDLDHNQNMPYIFRITKGSNHWVIFTYARNYLITASNMQLETYQSRYNKYKNIRLKNFCQLESHGRISRGESMVINIDGDLSPYTNSFNCNISTYRDENFYIYKDPQGSI
jgi:hypothetical protein